MKLKKVISLVLGGVMALSMLTACGGTDDTTTSAANAVASATTNSTVVNYVVKYLGDNPNVTIAQQEATLTGNESADTATAASRLAMEWTDTANTDYHIAAAADFTSGNAYILAKSKTYVFVVPKNDTKDLDFAVNLLSFIDGANAAGVTVKKLTVLDATFDGVLLNNYVGTGTVGSTSVSGVACWVVIVTT